MYFFSALHAFHYRLVTCLLINDDPFQGLLSVLLVKRHFEELFLELIDLLLKGDIPLDLVFDLLLHQSHFHSKTISLSFVLGKFLPLTHYGLILFLELLPHGDV